MKATFDRCLLRRERVDRETRRNDKGYHLLAGEKRSMTSDQTVEIEAKLSLMFTSVEATSRGRVLRMVLNDNISRMMDFERDYSYRKLTLGPTGSPNLVPFKVVSTRKRAKTSLLEGLERDTRNTRMEATTN